MSSPPVYPEAPTTATRTLSTGVFPGDAEDVLGGEGAPRRTEREEERQAEPGKESAAAVHEVAPVGGRRECSAGRRTHRSGAVLRVATSGRVRDTAAFRVPQD